MTVDLDMMLDLRDAQVAEEVRRKAELGWFDTEFTIYGCCYQKNNERYYRLSAEMEKIYDFIESAAQKNIVPSCIQIHSEKYSVPIGMKDSVTLDVKKILATEMQAMFPMSFFQYMNNLKKEAVEDSGYFYLLQKKDKVESSFQLLELRKYKELLDHFLNCNKVSYEHYTLLDAWIKDEYKNMEEEPIQKDLYEKVFYGIAYLKGKEIKYSINAQKATVYRKRNELMRKGFFTTHLYSQVYYYNHNVRLPDVHKRFEQELKGYFTLEFVSELQMQLQRNEQISKEKFEDEMNRIEDAYGIAVKETMKQYGYLWGIL